MKIIFLKSISIILSFIGILIKLYPYFITTMGESPTNTNLIGNIYLYFILMISSKTQLKILPLKNV